MRGRLGVARAQRPGRDALGAYARAGGSPAVTARGVGTLHALSALEHVLFVPEATPRWGSVVAWIRAAAARFPVAP